MKRYNGWKNWETWNCKLWLDNDDFQYQDYFEQDLKNENKEEAVESIASQLEDILEESYPENIKGMYADFLSSAMDRIDYDEIADAIYEDNKLF